MKRPLLGTALAMACAAAHCQFTTWDFTYTGFFSDERHAFVPDAVLRGSFVGTDQNANGVIEKQELSGLFLSNRNIAVNLLQCGPEAGIFFECNLESFSYGGQGGLNFIGSHNSFDENNGYTESVRVSTGDMWVSSYGSVRTGDSHSTNWYWTSDTVLSVVSSVPEPGQGWLLALGLGILAFGGHGRTRMTIASTMCATIAALTTTILHLSTATATMCIAGPHSGAVPGRRSKATCAPNGSADTGKANLRPGMT